jgi:hypothetical protein
MIEVTNTKANIPFCADYHQYLDNVKQEPFEIRLNFWIENNGQFSGNLKGYDAKCQIPVSQLQGITPKNRDTILINDQEYVITTKVLKNYNPLFNPFYEINLKSKI